MKIKDNKKNIVNSIKIKKKNVNYIAKNIKNMMSSILLYSYNSIMSLILWCSSQRIILKLNAYNNHAFRRMNCKLGFFTCEMHFLSDCGSTIL